MKIRLVLMCSLFAVPALARSSSPPSCNGDVLTTNMLQSLDATKMNISSLGLPGFAAKLDALGRITAPVIGDTSASPVKTQGLAAPRTLSNRFADYKNLRDYGAALNNSWPDKLLIQEVYNSLSDGSVMHVPAGSRWDGTINTPNPEKISRGYLTEGTILLDGNTPGRR